MLIIPAIDIHHGSCVRLFQGRESQATVYGKSPLEMAELWMSQGATILHVADLDAAFLGKPVNLEMVAKITNLLHIPIQMGGGFRDIDSIAQAMDLGIAKVILGTAAIHNPALVAEAVGRFGASITVSIDVAEEFVAIEGWKELSGVRFDDLAMRMREIGLKELLFTDTRKDGTLSGPNIGAIRLFLAAARLPVIVSGGITTVDDLHALKELESEGLRGVVIGKALYDHKLSLHDALLMG